MATLAIETLEVVHTAKPDVKFKLENKDGGVLGVYFSAHWCPPCRNFTPKLREFYTKVKEAQGDKFEIVFVSSDKEEKSFKDYFSEMPWLALPFDLSDKKAELAKQYNVSGIPTLVFVDMGNGKTITTKGRDTVDKDPNGAEFMQ